LEDSPDDIVIQTIINSFNTYHLYSTSIDEPVLGSAAEDFDDKTVATTASEFDTMGLNPYQAKRKPDMEERESTRSSPPYEVRDSEAKRRSPEEKPPKPKTIIEEDEQQQKQPKKVKKDVKRKLELLEKAKAEGKGQFQRDRRKYLVDAKKDLEKKRTKGGGETGVGRKTGQTERNPREKPDDDVKVKVRKNKKGLLKRFKKERGKSREKAKNDASSDDNSDLSTEDDKEPRNNDNVRLDKDLDQSSSADVTGHSKQGYSSSRPPAHPVSSSNHRSWSPPSPRSRQNPKTNPLDSRKRSTSSKSTKSRPHSVKKDRGRSRKTSHSVSRGQSSSASKGEERSHAPSFSFFRHRSKSTPISYTPHDRASTPGNMSKASKMSNSSAYSKQSHTLEMLGGSSDSNDSKFFTG